ncbi:MAG TPA: DUF3311 domain-containing protein [Terriglobales bacterium]|jgi:hypothetical protein
MPPHTDPVRRARRRQHWYWLLVVPFIFLLWVPLYARDTPELFGFPFFYWYQFAWVIGSAGITGFVYWITEKNQ